MKPRGVCGAYVLGLLGLMERLLLSSLVFFFFSSRRRHTRYIGDWSSDGALPILISRYSGELLEHLSTTFTIPHRYHLSIRRQPWRSSRLSGSCRSGPHSSSGRLLA